VKTLVQDELQLENVTFFAARVPAVSRANSPGTALDGPMADGSVTCNANYSLDGMSRYRIIYGGIRVAKRMRTVFAELVQKSQQLSCIS
jgi:hypothetical protein